jgi:hypothetical protein
MIDPYSSKITSLENSFIFYRRETALCVTNNRCHLHPSVFSVATPPTHRKSARNSRNGAKPKKML